MFLTQAPVVIVVCAVPARSGRRYRERGEKLYCLQDTAAAVQNILLAAAGSGIGTCWVGAFDEEGVRRVLGLGHDLRPVAMIPLGYPDEVPSVPGRRSLEEIVHLVD
jgi:nitroreductase